METATVFAVVAAALALGVQIIGMIATHSGGDLLEQHQMQHVLARCWLRQTSRSITVSYHVRHQASHMRLTSNFLQHHQVYSTQYGSQTQPLPVLRSIVH